MTAAGLVERVRRAVSVYVTPDIRAHDAARAAIAETLAAIREPTQAMVADGRAVILPNLHGARSYDARACWRAMIDALTAEIGGKQ